MHAFLLKTLLLYQPRDQHVIVDGRCHTKEECEKNVFKDSLNRAMTPLPSEVWQNGQLKFEDGQDCILYSYQDDDATAMLLDNQRCDYRSHFLCGRDNVDSSKCSIHGKYERCSCTCRRGYSGINCDVCNTNPDIDNKTCSRHGTYTPCKCTCHSGYSGINCTVCGINNKIDNKTCSRHGTYKSCECTCNPGYSGINCDVCDIKKAIDNKTCSKHGSYKPCECSCRTGYSGINCEHCTNNKQICKIYGIFGGDICLCGVCSTTCVKVTVGVTIVVELIVFFFLWILSRLAKCCCSRPDAIDITIAKDSSKRNESFGDDSFSTSPHLLPSATSTRMLQQGQFYALSRSLNDFR